MWTAECPAVGGKVNTLGQTRSSDESMYERPPNRGRQGKGSVRAAVLQEKEALKKNDQHTSQQDASSKPSSGIKSARPQIDRLEDNNMQVDDEGMGDNNMQVDSEGMRDNEEREAIERSEGRRNVTNKAVEPSAKRKTAEKGNTLSPQRYVTCDCCLCTMLCAHQHGSRPYSHHSHRLSQTTCKKATPTSHICK